MNAILGWRRRAAVVALVVVTLAVLARVVGVALTLTGGGDPDVLSSSALALGQSETLLTVVAGTLVGSCYAGPAVAARRGLALWGAVVTGVSFLAGLAAVIVAATGPTLQLRVSLLVTAVPLLVVVALVCTGLVAALRDDPAVGAEPGPESKPEPPEAVPAADPEQQPTWPSDEAAGTVWLSAGDAARGVPGTGWGAAAGSGWQRADDAGPPSLEAGSGPDRASGRGDDDPVPPR